MRGAWLATAALALAAANAAAAEPLARWSAAEGAPAASILAEALRFRRVYAPADRLKDWPRDQARYVPMAKAEFERLVEAARFQSGLPAGKAWPGIAAAQYSARLVDDALVDGEATLDVRTPAAATTVVLDPCGLAIAEAAWLGQTRQPARVTLGAEGKLSVRAERPGRLQLKWSLRGQRSPTGALQFACALPQCPLSRFVLTLPKGLTPLVQSAIVAEDGAPDPAGVRWSIDLGGRHRFTLRIVASENLRPGRKLATVKQDGTYDFSLQGVELSSRLTLDVPDVPLRQFAVELDPPLKLLGARLGDVPLGWSAIVPAGKDGKTQVILEFPEPIEGLGKVLRLAAAAPVELANRWRLPGIRPKGLFWQEGTATLVVPAPLTLEQATATAGRQTQSGALPAPRSGEATEFQLFSPEAAVEIVLAKPEPPPVVDCGTALELSAVDMAAEVIGMFRVPEGERFQIEADVSRRWAIDSVETIPAAALEDWTLHSDAAGPARLRIRLARSLSAARPLRVIIDGRHHYSPLGRLLTRSDLVPIEFRGTQSGKRLVAVRAAEACRLRLSGAEQLTRVDPQSLTAADLELFDDPPKDLLFLDDAQAATLHIALERQTPTYSGTIRVEATATDAGLVESYVFRCVPEAVRVDRLLLQFSQRRDVPLRWSFAAAEEDQVSVSRKEPSRSAAHSHADSGEALEIVFRRPRSVPFEIRAARTLPFTEAVSVALASMPEAASQQGSLVIGSARASEMGIQTRRLTAMPPEPVAAGQSSSARAAYRYDPARDVGPASDAAAVLSPGPSEPGCPSAWAWSRHVESRYETGGSACHWVTYRLENSGTQAIALRLPEGSSAGDVRGVWVDGMRTPLETGPGEAATSLTIRLPEGRRFPVVTLCLATSGPAMGTFATLKPMLPVIDLPVFESHWTVWLPPGYRSSGTSAQSLWPRQAGRTVSQRLFGPFGRAAGSAPFRLSDAKDWEQWAGVSSVPPSVRRTADQFIERLDLAEMPASAAPADAPTAARAVSWGEYLARTAAGMNLVVLVDHGALSRAGITPRATVPGVPNGLSSGGGCGALEQAGLVLLVWEDAVVLTTAFQAALDRAQLVPQESDTVWCVRPGPLAREIAAAGEDSDDPRLVTLDTWSAMPEGCRSPWYQAPDAGPGPAEMLGWSACRLPLRDDEQVTLSAVREDTLATLSWAVFLAVFALVAWKGRARPALVAGLVGTWACAALLVPEAYSPLASGGLLGTSAAALLSWITRRARITHAEKDSAISTQTWTPAPNAVQTGALLLAIAAGLCFRSSAVMGGEPAASASSDGTTYQVFIPVDEKHQPSGDKYYVPEGLLSQLQAAAASRSEEPRTWRLVSAVYRGILNLQGAPEQLVLTELRATLEIQVVGRQARVRIPLGREGVEPSTDGVTLEGRAIQPTWPDGDGGLAFDAAEPGTYRLELAVRPSAAPGARTLIRWKIPPLATSRLELSVPREAPDVEFPTALGAVVREADPPRLTVMLGPTDQLQIGWTEAGAGLGGTSALEVEQLLWLKLQPGSVVLDCQFQFKVARGRVREVQLATDPRLQLLPAKGERPASAQVSAGSEGFQRIRFELPRPIADKFSLPASFLLRESSGVGSYRLPLVEVLGARTTRRWLAVSVDPSLEHRQAGTERLQAVAVPTFLSAWGGAKLQPLFAWDAPGPRPDWSISTSSRPSRIAAEQTLSVTFAPRTARLTLAAKATDSAGAAFQYRIVAPPELEIEQISLAEGSVQRVARWSRAADGAITVRLDGPAAGARLVTLRGSLPTPESGKLALPVVRLDADPLKPMEIALFREPAVQVEVASVAGLVAAEAPAVDLSRGSFGRLVKAFRVESAGPARATVVISPNRPKIQAEQITRLRGEGDAWQADVNFRFKVSGGVADQFSFDVPPQWSGPYKVDPPAAIKVLDSPDRARRQLIVRPRAAVEGEYRMGISGPLTLGLNERPSALKVVAEDVVVNRHRLILPGAPEGSAGAWETRGLVPTSLPQDLPIAAAERGGLVAYLVAREPYQAVLRFPEQAEGTPHVPYAELRLTWQADGDYRGVVSFDLEPAGSDSCPLTLPPELRLMQVLVDGLPTLPVPAGVNQWRLLLASTRLTQHVEVLFRGKLPDTADARRRRFPVPTLGAIPVRQAVWSVAGPTGYAWSPGEGEERLGALQHALVQVRNLAAIVERAAEFPGDDPEDTARWYRRWARRWTGARLEMARQLALAGSGSKLSAVREEVESLEKRQAAAGKRLGLSELASQAAGEPLVRQSPADLWELAAPAAARFRAPCGPEGITLVYRQGPHWRLAPRGLMALILGGLTVGVVWCMRRGVVPKGFAGLAYGVGIVVGLVWWWWLSPSILGWVLIVASLGAALASFWQRRRKSALTPTSVPPL